MTRRPPLPLAPAAALAYPLRAFTEGRYAAQCGMSVDTCPYSVAKPAMREAWRWGYRQIAQWERNITQARAARRCSSDVKRHVTPRNTSNANAMGVKRGSRY